MKRLHTYQITTTNCRMLTIIVSILVIQAFILATPPICQHSLFSGVVSYVIKNTTFEELGQTRGSSAAAIQFSFRNQVNCHSRSLCYQCIFNPVPLSILSLLSCAFALSSSLICKGPKEMCRCAENQCHCCGIYHFQRPDQICETPARDPASLPSTRFPYSREKSNSQKRR